MIATPIGNLEDITLRALRLLGEVALVAAEDTRHTRKLLTHFNISKPLISYYKQKENIRAGQIIEKLAAGEDVALVSDAGTPGISDPGAILVEKTVKAGYRVVPVPGPSALSCALSVSGFGQTAVLFLGFLPSRKGERKKVLKQHVADDSCLAFYESPRRIKNSLQECLEILEDRQVCLARELTKIHEEILHGRLIDVAAELQGRKEIKGEFVVILAGAEKDITAPDSGDVQELLTWFRDQTDLSLKDAVKKVSRDLGLRRSDIYQQALELWNR